jgi:DNA helicase-2/ATP-dependent DNA helicase PcrA
MEDALRGAGVPYVIARGTAFYEREEVRHALAYLRVIANPADSVSLARIINTPARGIGKTTLDALDTAAQARGVTLLDACRDAPQIDTLAPRALPAIAKFLALLDAWNAPRAPDASLADLVRRIIEQSGLRAMYVAQAAAGKSDADAERIDNLDELVSSARQFEQEYDPSADAAAEGAEPSTPAPVLVLLRAFLESVSLVADADAIDPAQGAVTLMTLHAAKGLEFDSVAMIGLEEGLLPHSRAVLSPLAGDAELEEERRLCFVGITRAMRRLLLTSAKLRTIRGVPERTIPSRFLADIPPDLMRISDQSEPEDDAWGTDTGSYQTRSSRHDSGPVSEGLANAARPATGVAAQLPIGSKVRHPRFGIGIVQTVQGGANARATIRFQDAGVKTLILEFAGLTRLP